ncbi:MAG: M20 family metallo-hydrolase [Phycisphaerales bacterium]|nr:M20 family metallo-hydrolase [Phycisphaerales bacterium]
MNTSFPTIVELLKQLISLESISKQEGATADCIMRFMQGLQIPVQRYLNNVWATNQYFDSQKPTLLLNSHHDTVKPNPSYTIDPFTPLVQDGKIYGLGSNDAGGSVVSLIAVFLYFYDQPLDFNICLAITAEEEISGKNGIEALLQNVQFPKINCALVGEPTRMNMAIAEKGLLVLDCVVKGITGHAAREEGVNAIYLAMHDIRWFHTYQFEKQSQWLGPVKMSVTAINTPNIQHNVVPESCSFIVDIRVNELYSVDDILATVQSHVTATCTPRSTRCKSSAISIDHPLVVAGKKNGLTYYGSPTTSDQALMHFPCLKIGPGDSARSHSANEFIYLDEIEQGINIYRSLIKALIL